MARKAVQGYTEKSYYDNTRYIGNVSTLDPLLEGSFRHLVNFNISDTNQSLEPREGFLTTSLASADAADPITLSSQTIMYKDQSTQRHIVFDLGNHKAYLVDVSAYNVHNNMIPFEREIRLDFSELQQMYVEWYLKDLKQTPPFQLTEKIYPDSNNRFSVYEISNIEFDTYPHRRVYEVSPGDAVIRQVWHYIEEDSQYYNDLDPGTIHTSVVQLQDAVDGYNSSFAFRNISDSDISYALTHTKFVGKVATIFDEVLSKTIHIVPIEFTPTQGKSLKLFMTLTFRNRQATVNGETLPGDTLLIGAINFKDIGSYNPLERNIASSRSIFPDTFQTVYTEANRPDGHIDTIGMFYAYNNNKQAMINTIQPRQEYTFIPHFELNPASISTPGADSWAYAFDIVSTKPQSLLLGESQEAVVARSDWKNYTTNTPVLQPLRHNDISFTYNNHVLGSRYVITLIPTRRARLHIPGSDDGFEYYTSFTTAALKRHRAWAKELKKAVDIQSLIQAVTKIDDAHYIFHDVQDDSDVYITPFPSLDTFLTKSGVVKYGKLNTELLYLKRMYHSFPTIDSQGEGYTYYTKDDYVPDFFPYETRVLLGGGSGMFHPDDVDVPAGDANTFIANTDVVYTKEQMLDMLHTKKLPLFIGQHGVLDVSYRLLSAAAIADSDYVLETHYSPICYYYRAVEDENTFSYEDYNEVKDYIISPTQIHPINSVLSYKICPLVNQYLLHTDTKTLLNDTFKDTLHAQGYFLNGYHIRLYLRPYNRADYTQPIPYDDYITHQTAWRVDAYSTVLNVTFAHDKLSLTTIEEYVKDHPERIANFDGYTIFEDSRLVFWKDNYIYISEPGRPHYFKEDMIKSYNEKVVKVVPYKSILLVFTVQNLYAVYENVVTQEGKDHEGKSTSVEIRNWVTTTVLYNILTNKKYADVIQVFNQMVLFYSDDGQLFLIKPNTMIDSDTRFSLQYFNKSCNDILANYDKYINERLEQYNIKQRITKDDVIIKAEVSINYIKIFYSVKDVITYILIYDVLNNRYYVYDTLSFTNIKDMLYTDSGSLYNTINKDKMYFTMQHTERIDQDVNVDQAVYHNFKKAPILCLIDTGNLSLNNHLRKRFRDLHITFKNLSSSKLLYNVETVIDDVVSHPFYDEQLLVKEFNGQTYYITVPKANENDLVELSTINQISGASTNIQEYLLHNPSLAQGNIIFNFKNIVSSKILTHRSSILGMGNVFRAKMLFTSKGKYKIQSYGIVYKERRV